MIVDESLTFFFLQAWNIINNTDYMTVYRTVYGENMRSELSLQIQDFAARGDHSELCQKNKLLWATKRNALDRLVKFTKVSLYAFVFDF